MINFTDFSDRHIKPFATKIVLDSEILRKDGSIGGCTLREIADKWHYETGLTVASCLRCVSDEAYRILALRYIENGKD